MNYVDYVKENPNLAQMKESTRYPGLFVLKYKRNVFYDNLWDESLVEMRGRVVDANGFTVINPFTKIFNRGENNTDIDRDEMVLSIDKINGFMAGVTYVPSLDEVVVSTTGSLDSDFVTLAEKHLHHIKDEVCKAYYLTGVVYTWLFEIVDESDPHIIKEKPGAYLIGGRRIDEKTYVTSELFEESLDALAVGWCVYRPTWSVCRFSDVVNEVKDYNREGVVVYGLTSGTALKIKSPFYLVSKFLGRVGTTKLHALLNDKQRFIQTLKDEEFLPLIDFLITFKDIFLCSDQQRRIGFIQTFITARLTLN